MIKKPTAMKRKSKNKYDPGAKAGERSKGYAKQAKGFVIWIQTDTQAKGRKEESKRPSKRRMKAFAKKALKQEKRAKDAQRK